MKQRLDSLLVERGMVETRNKAAAMIMAGEVVVNEQAITKAGQQVDVESEIRIKNKLRYVSRAGDKLESVIEPLDLDFTDKVVVDVGSSTGGFTECVLAHGARKVYAIDVGTNQLAYKLRNDQRIVVMEQTDIRSVDELLDQPDVAVIDVSFISLTKILEQVAKIVGMQGQIVAMVKPQFEAGKAVADAHKGLIVDEEVRQQVLSDLRAWVLERFEILDEADSAVAGKHGNRERFFLLTPKS